VKTLPLDSPPHAILDTAADIIAANGRHIGGLWEFAHRLRWVPTMRCCVTGAIGIALGLNESWAVEDVVVPAVHIGTEDAVPPHPAFAALMAHLGFDCVNDVFRWSDEHDADEIAAELRACALALRGTGVPA
jgi:hypothetical protein